MPRKRPAKKSAPKKKKAADSGVSEAQGKNVGKGVREAQGKDVGEGVTQAQGKDVGGSAPDEDEESD